MKSSPGVRHHLADGMTGEQIVTAIDRAQRRDPSVVTVEPAFDGVVTMNRRFTLSSQSCFSAPSWLTTNSGISGTTLEWPGATTVADSRPMIVIFFAVGALAGETVRTAELL